MKGVSQLLSNWLGSYRSLSGTGSFLRVGDAGGDSDHLHRPDSVTEPRTRTGSPLNSEEIASNSNHNREDGTTITSRRQLVDDSACSETDRLAGRGKMDPVSEVEELRVKFFRILQRFGFAHDDLLVTKVLYRIHLAATIRGGDSDLMRSRSDRARAAAMQQEVSGVPRLEFSVRILVLGKTGVGKSATINSVFDEVKTVTNAFQPGTDCIREVTGMIDGVKVTFIDTPGLLPSSTGNLRRNRKIMVAIQRFIRKSPPDIVLFFERMDLISTSYTDFPLLMLITNVFGPSIWFNTILVMTHASSTPEGSNGYPVSYDAYVDKCKDLMQHYIHQAMSDSKLENPTLLVENHPLCGKNSKGEMILPNGQVWRSHFLLLCICTKVLADASNLLNFQDSIQLGPSISPRVPSLPHLLSSILRHRPALSPGEEDCDMDQIFSLDADEEDEYDQLPPIRILTKSQFCKLTKSQKQEYLDELEYRETLFLMKQLREGYRKRREKRLAKESNIGGYNDSDNQQASSDSYLLPDMEVPLSFSSDCPLHRYRFVVTNDQWLVRPVLDPQGWDHDVGFDGINLEMALEIKKNVYASIMGQMSKDKQNFSIQSESTAVYMDSNGPTFSLVVDVQSTGKDLICTLHGNTKVTNLKHHSPCCGVSLTSFGNKCYLGAKIEDTIYVAKRLKFVINAGQMSGMEKTAYGGSFEATIRGRDYPARNYATTLSMTALSFDKETVVGGGIQSEFQPIRGMRVAVNGNINSRQMGQISLKMSSSGIEIAMIAVFSIFRALLHRKPNESQNKEVTEMG